MSKRKDETTEDNETDFSQAIVQPPGFEWSQLLSDIHITATEIEQALWNASLTEPEHAFTKPNEMNGAFLTVLRAAIGDLRQKVRELNGSTVNQ